MAHAVVLYLTTPFFAHHDLYLDADLHKVGIEDVCFVQVAWESFDDEAPELVQCENIFRALNTGVQNDKGIRSMSVGDLVVVGIGNARKTYRCNDFGFGLIDNFCETVFIPAH